MSYRRLNPTELLQYADRLSDDLEDDMSWVPSSGGYGYWRASPPEKIGVIRSRATAAIELLRTYAGDDSEWTERARQLYENSGENQSRESGARAVGELLRAWSAQVLAGVIGIRRVDSLNNAALASTDLMEQVRRLMEDSNVTPAAPIVLAAAALEIALRSLIEANDGAPRSASLSAYASELRRLGVISKQEVKDIEQVAGVRNSAAHGHLEHLSIERAGLHEQQVNLLLSVLGDRQLPRGSAPSDKN